MSTIALTWFKSSCNGGGSCVEFVFGPGAVPAGIRRMRRSTRRLSLLDHGQRVQGWSPSRATRRLLVQRLPRRLPVGAVQAGIVRKDSKGSESHLFLNWADARGSLRSRPFLSLAGAAAVALLF